VCVCVYEDAGSVWSGGGRDYRGGHRDDESTRGMYRDREYEREIEIEKEWLVRGSDRVSERDREREVR